MKNGVMHWNLRTVKPMKLIAEGSFGTVGAAQHKITREIAALKIIHKVCDDPIQIKFQNRLIDKELQAWSRVTGHELIIELKGHFEGKNKYYFVSELAEKGSLYNLICAKGFLDITEIRTITAQIATALHYIHSKKVMHRDLKPANVLIGNDRKIKLADFGLSKIGLRSKSIVGTPEYTAPEVYRGKAYGVSCDWYSLGVIMYEMFTGNPPWNNMLQIPEKEYDRLSIFARAEYIKKIVETDTDISCDIPYKEAAILIRKLTIRKVKRRIGHSRRSALKELRCQPFFESHNWDELVNSPVV